MSTILKYEVVDAPSVELLVEHVQDTVSDGWQPLGSPFYLNGSMYQAIVWTEESEASLPARVAALEQEAIEEALAAEGGNQSRAAALLGISERALRYKLAKYRGS